MHTESTTKNLISLCDPALIRRLKALDSCAVADAADALDRASEASFTEAVYYRSNARVASGIQPLNRGGCIAGTVTTVALQPVKGRIARVVNSEALDTGHLGTSTIAAAQPGQVVVVANGGRLEMGAWGGLLSLAAQEKGLAGVVVDGACRDIDEIRQLGLPVFARGGTPTTARGRVEVASRDAAVFVSGVRVEPRDFVIADSSGVVFIPRQAAPQVIERAEVIAKQELELATQLRQGRKATEALGPRYEEMLNVWC
jgi:regulator of RNase E activity RraA